MNVNLRLNKDEEVMMSALLIKMPKFRKQEKGTRIGGSTTHLLPEPRANGFQRDRAI